MTSAQEDSMTSPQRSLAGGLLLTSILLLLFFTPTDSFAIPVFARKYGLPCSACHEAWPKLNSFGQKFKDYQRFDRASGRSPGLAPFHVTANSLSEYARAASQQREFGRSAPAVRFVERRQNQSLDALVICHRVSRSRLRCR